jgi:hypothetical protein
MSDATYQCAAAKQRTHVTAKARALKLEAVRGLVHEHNLLKKVSALFLICRCCGLFLLFWYLPPSSLSFFRPPTRVARSSRVRTLN